MVKAVFLILFCFITAAYADTLYLKNGRSIQGLIKSENEGAIELEVNGGIVKFKKSEVEKIEKVSSEEAVRIRRKWEGERKELQERISQQQLEEENKPHKQEFSQSDQGIILPVTLNKKVEASLVLDTGASIMLLRKDVAKKLGLDLDTAKFDMQVQLADGRKVNAKYIVLESVRVQNSEALNVKAAVLLDEADISFGEGLLGMSFLSRFNFKVDQKEKKLTLEKL